MTNFYILSLSKRMPPCVLIGIICFVLTLFFLSNIQTAFPVAPSLAANPTMAFNPYLAHPGVGLVPAELLPNTPLLFSGNPPLALPGAAGPKLMRSDKLEVFV